MTDVELDATEAVMAENQFNDPPADGRQFVMSSVDATYEGEDSDEALFLPICDPRHPHHRSSQGVSM